MFNIYRNYTIRLNMIKKDDLYYIYFTLLINETNEQVIGSVVQITRTKLDHFIKFTREKGMNVGTLNHYIGYGNKCRHELITDIILTLY